MGLTNQSTGVRLLETELKIVRSSPDDKVIALAGNPNVGKSTVFNSLTGLNQHTGNWPGKTVTNAQGRHRHKDKNFILVDIPGTYSLMANSVEEEVARDFICFGNADAIVVVTDATCLERNLNLVLQTLEITDKVVVCVNLIDEAKRKKINVNCSELSKILGIPVVPTIARNYLGLNELMDAVYDIADNRTVTNPVKIIYDEPIEKAIEMIQPEVLKTLGGRINSRWVALRLLENDPSLLRSLDKYLGFNLADDGELVRQLESARDYLIEKGIPTDQLRDKIVTRLVRMAEDISRKIITFEGKVYGNFDRKIDRVLTSRIFGIPIMLGLLALIFWITIEGANVPSGMLADFLFSIEAKLTELFTQAGSPQWLHDILVLGMYRTLAWVVSVMLPPMAIFFPLFTLLEDLGYLPRVAFNLDNFFKRACAHGKQALTMCMGFGCNAAGVIGCRIINSPRERLIAIITNAFVPCNGRFPTLIALSTIFIGGTAGGAFKSLYSTLALTAIVLIGIFMTLLVSRILSKTILKGLPSSFTLELPPYRRPQVGRIIVRSIFDRTLFVLGRAVAIAAPAGVVIWVMANINIGGASLLSYSAGFLDPFGKMIGMDGYILMAFILGLPANEIVIPVLIMSYMSSGSMLELEELEDLRRVLEANGWTWLTGICVMLFSLMHFPCGTTLWTIRKETQSMKWALASFAIPTAAGIIICFIVANAARILGLV
ncbi:ferrous iron transport protein B [Clostridium thermosuccinogenes]|uniref:ferrous iron transport protein B n=1 Tax=Clostridium thermosuccinogenes TaxID=84032 RepID=UPI000CCC465F|nr:ferrous iron transport protein B [Pseudoclostridium thermosuccinogenes]PNT92315.1 ferrous iron transport protein B [Pseudoclostridium thermosuccinogenes]